MGPKFSCLGYPCSLETFPGILKEKKQEIYVYLKDGAGRGRRGTKSVKDSRDFYLSRLRGKGWGVEEVSGDEGRRG